MTIAKRQKVVPKRAAPVGVGLSRASVIDSALNLIDRAGLETFSIRNLAKELKVNPTAIMWHIGSRSELLIEVVRIVQADLIPTDHSLTWQNWIRDLFNRSRTCIRRHPNVAPLIAVQLVPDVGFLYDTVEALLAVLSDAGFSGGALISAYNSIIAAAVGFPALEFAPVPGDDGKDWEAGMKARLEGVDKRLHPRLAANIDALSNRAFITRWDNGATMPMDDTFEFYIDMVIGGLERLSNEGGRSTSRLSLRPSSIGKRS